ncbi:hypothetical protein RRG08_009138 [Elysia crispata]|uniref:Uncharacterized protein n=1 Tax=Elysia crispata TaxID=231223 RepID=A0AAE0YQL9_9GAST|nr:hypothetical protein RRG08_009138 [Elysia crispata]
MDNKQNVRHKPQGTSLSPIVKFSSFAYPPCAHMCNVVVAALSDVSPWPGVTLTCCLLLTAQGEPDKSVDRDSSSHSAL